MTTTNWIELPKLVEFLYCSERTVYKLKKANVFVAGEHFYRVGEGREKGKCIYNLEKCREALLLYTKEGQEKKKGARYRKNMLKDLVNKEAK